MADKPLGLERRLLTLEEYAAGVRDRNRAILGRAITLIESSRRDDQHLAQQLLERLLPTTGRSIRVGITGVPGAGKSTLIDVLGSRLTAAGHRLAVLAVDPSSPVSGGSFLGDKVRMARLRTDPHAYVRPSPSGQTPGGVARKTREALLLCEAAGYDVVLVETVGVGQVDTAVAGMTDFFLVLLIAGAGDEVQVCKRGLLELANLVAITKADGDNRPRAERDAVCIRQMLQLLRGSHPQQDMLPPVITCSALEGTGLDLIWQDILRHHEKLHQTGQLHERRRAQEVKWMWSLVEESIQQALRTHPQVRDVAAHAEQQINKGKMTAACGAKVILEAFGLPPE